MTVRTTQNTRRPAVLFQIKASQKHKAAVSVNVTAGDRTRCISTFISLCLSAVGNRFLLKSF